MKSEDEILQLFAKAIVDRHLFEWTINPDEHQINTIKKYLKEQNRSEAYFYYEDISSNKTYFPYDEKNAIIWIRDSHQNLKPLSECSEIVKALLRMESHTEQRIYYWKRKKD
jgi:HD superfamily phosphohydrolase